jgi:uncharacterized protein
MRGMSPVDARVTELWRYPVKSLAGERLPAAEIGELGIAGDRSHGLVDLGTGLVLTARRVPDLLFASTVTSDAGDVAVRLPDGSVTADAVELSAWLGRHVELRRAEPATSGRYEIAANDDRPDGEWYEWDGPEGVFHDSSRTRVSIVSEASLADWDVRRFRPNVVISGTDERDLLGATVRIGTAELEVVKEIDRCVIVTRPQPGLDRDKSVLVAVHRERNGNMGVGAIVRTRGTTAVGDPISVID